MVTTYHKTDDTGGGRSWGRGGGEGGGKGRAEED